MKRTLNPNGPIRGIVDTEELVLTYKGELVAGEVGSRVRVFDRDIRPRYFRVYTGRELDLNMLAIARENQLAVPAIPFESFAGVYVRLELPHVAAGVELELALRNSTTKTVGYHFELVCNAVKR